MANRGIELEGKFSVFVDPIPQFSKEDLLTYIAAGYELGLVPVGQGGIGMKYVDRGDVAAYDFELAGLVMDGAGHDMDLSGILPIGARLASMRIFMTVVGAGEYFYLVEKGNVNAINLLRCVGPAAGGSIEMSGIVKTDASRFLTYVGNVQGAGALGVVVRGWIL